MILCKVMRAARAITLVIEMCNNTHITKTMPTSSKKSILDQTHTDRTQQVLIIKHPPRLFLLFPLHRHRLRWRHRRRRRRRIRHRRRWSWSLLFHHRGDESACRRVGHDDFGCSLRRLGFGDWGIFFFFSYLGFFMGGNWTRWGIFHFEMRRGEREVGGGRRLGGCW